MFSNKQQIFSNHRKIIEKANFIAQKFPLKKYKMLFFDSIKLTKIKGENLDYLRQFIFWT